MNRQQTPDQHPECEIRLFPFRKGTLFLFLFFWVGASCQNYSFQLFNEDNGLRHSYIYCLSQSQQGYLYISAGDGFYRFDGRSFLDLSDKRTSANLVTFHLIDSRNRIWIGQNQNGISYYDGKQFLPVEIPSLESVKVTGLVE